MPGLDLVDSTWIGAPRASVASAVGDASRWPRWWPDLELVVVAARGVEGMRWRVRSGALSGSMEIWLQPVNGGVVLHYFLALRRSDDHVLRPGQQARLARLHRYRAKRVFWALADELDPARLARLPGPGTGPGCSRAAR